MSLIKVGNFDERCTGKWTRIQARKDGKVNKSVLDYVLLTENMHTALNGIKIDEEKIYCPYRGPPPDRASIFFDGVDIFRYFSSNENYRHVNEKYRKVSKSIEKCRKISKKYRKISKNIEKCRKISKSLKSKKKY